MYFGKHALQLCHIIWETIEIFATERMHLLTGSLPQPFFWKRFHNYAMAVYENEMLFVTASALLMEHWWDIMSFLIHETTLYLRRAQEEAFYHSSSPLKLYMAWNVIPMGLFKDVVKSGSGTFAATLENNCRNAYEQTVLGSKYGSNGYARSYFDRDAAPRKFSSGFWKSFQQGHAKRPNQREMDFKGAKTLLDLISNKSSEFINLQLARCLCLAISLYNMRNCINPLQICQIFNCIPTSLEQYIWMKQ